MTHRPMGSRRTRSTPWELPEIAEDPVRDSGVGENSLGTIPAVSGQMRPGQPRKDMLNLGHPTGRTPLCDCQRWVGQGRTGPLGYPSLPCTDLSQVQLERELGAQAAATRETSCERAFITRRAGRGNDDSRTAHICPRLGVGSGAVRAVLGWW